MVRYNEQFYERIREIDSKTDPNDIAHLRSCFASFDYRTINPDDKNMQNIFRQNVLKFWQGADKKDRELQDIGGEFTRSLGEILQLARHKLLMLDELEAIKRIDDSDLTAEQFAYLDSCLKLNFNFENLDKDYFIGTDPLAEQIRATAQEKFTKALEVKKAAISNININAQAILTKTTEEKLDIDGTLEQLNKSREDIQNDFNRAQAKYDHLNSQYFPDKVKQKNAKAAYEKEKEVLERIQATIKLLEQIKKRVSPKKSLSQLAEKMRQLQAATEEVAYVAHDVHDKKKGLYADYQQAQTILLNMQNIQAALKREKDLIKLCRQIAKKPYERAYQLKKANCLIELNASDGFTYEIVNKDKSIDWDGLEATGPAYKGIELGPDQVIRVTYKGEQTPIIIEQDHNGKVTALSDYTKLSEEEEKNKEAMKFAQMLLINYSGNSKEKIFIDGGKKEAERAGRVYAALLLLSENNKDNTDYVLLDPNKIVVNVPGFPKPGMRESWQAYRQRYFKDNDGLADKKADFVSKYRKIHPVNADAEDDVYQGHVIKTGPGR